MTRGGRSGAAETGPEREEKKKTRPSSFSKAHVAGDKDQRGPRSRASLDLFPFLDFFPFLDLSAAGTGLADSADYAEFGLR